MEKFINFFWLFVFGSFFGFILETIWCIIRWKKIESRKGLIYGHFIPIYGIAGLLVAVVVELLNLSKKYMFFLVTFLIGGIVEYCSSFFQEKFTGTISWDYSDMKFNLHGRINLVYLIGFGFFGIAWCSIYPRFLSFLYDFFSDNMLIIFTIGMCLFMAYNMFISLAATVRQKSRRHGEESKNKFELWIDNKYPDERLAKIYANSKFVD